MMNLPKPAERSREQGFTLIELLIVVAIIGILAAIAIPQFGQYRESAAKSALESDLRTCLSEGLSIYAAGTPDDPTGWTDATDNDPAQLDCGESGIMEDDIADGEIVLTFQGGTPDFEGDVSVTTYNGVSFDAVNCTVPEGRRVVCEQDEDED